MEVFCEVSVIMDSMGGWEMLYDTIKRRGCRGVDKQTFLSLVVRADQSVLMPTYKAVALDMPLLAGITPS